VVSLFSERETTSPRDGDRAEDLDATVHRNLAARAASKRSNCKGPPGLPCAVTPQGTWPPWVPSKPSTILKIPSTDVCPVVDNYGVRQKLTPGRCSYSPHLDSAIRVCARAGRSTLRDQVGPIRLAATCVALTNNCAGRSNQPSPGSVACAKCLVPHKVADVSGWAGSALYCEPRRVGRD
jgi:hypothetical protein